MREYEHNVGRVSEEIPGIEWPIEGMDPDTMDAIIHSSSNTPLREILSRYVMYEGVQLWQRIKPIDYDTTPGTRSIQDIAINEGYTRVGRSVLTASNYMSDGPAAVQTQIRPIEILNMIDGNQGYPLTTTFEEINDRIRDSQTEKDRALTSHLRKCLIDEMHEAIESLTIDPSGLDWLRKRLSIHENVWNRIHAHSGELGTTEDPSVIGMRRGIERYKRLYHQAVGAGATPDKTPDRKKQLTLRVKRGVKRTVSTAGEHVLIQASNGIQSIQRLRSNQDQE